MNPSLPHKGVARLKIKRRQHYLLLSSSIFPLFPYKHDKADIKVNIAFRNINATASKNISPIV